MTNDFFDDTGPFKEAAQAVLESQYLLARIAATAATNTLFINRLRRAPAESEESLRVARGIYSPMIRD